MDLAALQERAASVAPMATGAVPILHGRVLRIDGDGLAYYCAGNDETSVGEARERVRTKVAESLRACGAEKHTILLTGSGGHKGHRYAIARVKPYQGGRVNSRRPKNWQALRDLLEAGEFGTPMCYHDREADDAFGQYGHADPENSVHSTQDKDMRMVPGWHLDWSTNRMTYLAPGEYDHRFNDKQYGLKWFWLQMLHGDATDFIPGLPKVVIGGKVKPMGEVTAANWIAHCDSSERAAVSVAAAYQTYYAERWLVEMMEQAALLWMRRAPDARWSCIIEPGGPLYLFNEQPEMLAACKEIAGRVQEAIDLNALSTQDH